MRHLTLTQSVTESQEISVCVCVCVMRSLLSTVRVQLLQNPFFGCRSIASAPETLFKEMVSLLRQPLLQMISPSFLSSSGSFTSHCCRSHPPLPSASFSLVCNSFTVFSLLVSLPSSLSVFFLKFCIQMPLYSSSPDSTLSLTLFFFLYSSFSFHTLFIPPPHHRLPLPPMPLTSFHFCVSIKAFGKEKKNFHRWFYLNTSTNEV